ncbi:TonB-dependent receptor [Thalassotalea agariperforans]
MSNRYKLNSIATAISVALLTVPSAYAAQEKTEDGIEIIEVTGFKGSLLRSLSNKRLNDAVSDSIFSEDIGKSADQDIGEALQRVTGVSIQRGEGAGGNEGTTVTIRGAGPNLNNISLNGINLTSSTENQAVDLSAYSSDILNSIEVIKTAAADQDEGSLGANIELKTLRALDVKEDRRILEVQGRYDDYASENDYKISGTFSQKFLDETLGFYITAFKETQSSRRDMYMTDRMQKFGAIAARTPSGELYQEFEEDGITPKTFYGFTNAQTGYKLFQNSMERQGFTTSLQWAVSDNTELNFGLTMSDQFRKTDDNSIASLGSGDAYLDVDLQPYGNKPFGNVLDENDPWLVYNPETQFFEKKIDRTARGRTARLQSGINTDNQIVNLELTHYFSDTFSMTLRGGYSKTKADDAYYSFLNSNNYAHVSDDALIAVDADKIQPTGYDCTSGQCYIVTGTGMVDFGPGQSGEIGEEIDDNIVLTAYNPDDRDAIHLQQAVSRDRLMEDKQKSLYADFDWQVDLGPITTVEFGGKYQTREKDVFNQEYWFEGIPEPDGQQSLGKSVDSIRLIDVTDGITPFGSDFLADLGYARTNTTDGWWTINARKSFDLLFANDDVRQKPNLANDRTIELENIAAYVKTNFTFLDDRLTGNVGLRYVESNLDNAKGYSSVDFQNTAVVSRDLVAIASNSSLPACTPEQLYANGVDHGDIANGGANPAGQLGPDGTWVSIPGQECYDENFDLTSNYRSRYQDLSKLEDPAQFSASASNKNKNWLPSLTLNYNLNDEMVLRFAASKTMARPKIDSLKPSYSIREFVWGAGNSIANLSNPYLKPLESKNIDLSFEWYFNEGGALTVAYFHKDMRNFEESASIAAHWKDLRSVTDEELTTLVPNEDIFIPYANGKPLDYDTAGKAAGCLEDHRHIWQSIALDVSSQCDTILVTSLRNGKGGTNQGIELGYNQNFDFLPGIFSGLGAAINYTYSDSETDAEAIELGGKLTPLPFANVSKHTYNISTFWEQDGNLVRLAWNHRTDSLANRSFESGALWNEGGGQLDLSANYQVNDNFTITFNAVNLNNKESRQYYTNIIDTDLTVEGNALEGNADKSKTIRKWSSGTIYRLGIRASF